MLKYNGSDISTSHFRKPKSTHTKTVKVLSTTECPYTFFTNLSPLLARPHTQIAVISFQLAFGDTNIECLFLYIHRTNLCWDLPSVMLHVNKTPNVPISSFVPNKRKRDAFIAARYSSFDHYSLLLCNRNGLLVYYRVLFARNVIVCVRDFLVADKSSYLFVRNSF